MCVLCHVGVLSVLTLWDWPQDECSEPRSWFCSGGFYLPVLISRSVFLFSVGGIRTRSVSPLIVSISSFFFKSFHNFSFCHRSEIDISVCEMLVDISKKGRVCAG